jgi:hypothetical protein
MKLKFFILFSFIITISCTPNLNINGGETISWTCVYDNQSYSWSGVYPDDFINGNASYETDGSLNNGLPEMNLSSDASGVIINFFANETITPGTYTTDQFGFSIQANQSNVPWSSISGSVTITSISPNSLTNSSYNYGLVKGSFSGVVKNPLNNQTKNISGTFECARID